jgi:hypothetical protein
MDEPWVSAADTKLDNVFGWFSQYVLFFPWLHEGHNTRLEGHGHYPPYTYYSSNINLPPSIGPSLLYSKPANPLDLSVHPIWYRYDYITWGILGYPFGVSPIFLGPPESLLSLSLYDRSKDHRRKFS